MMKDKYTLLIIGVVFLFLVFFFRFNNPQNSSPLPSSTPTITISIGQRTKTTNCIVNGVLPDKACTPGEVLPFVTKEQVCTSGYAKSVRNVSETEKNQAYTEYGIVSHTAGEYEVDHLISLELGGSNDIANLWPEAANPTPGFHEKDKVENYLHEQVCSGVITLEQAQKDISNNWVTVYEKMPKK